MMLYSDNTLNRCDSAYGRDVEREGQEVPCRQSNLPHYANSVKHTMPESGHRHLKR